MIYEIFENRISDTVYQSKPRRMECLNGNSQKATFT